MHRPKNYSSNEGRHEPDYKFESAKGISQDNARQLVVLPDGKKAVDEQDPTFADLLYQKLEGMEETS